MLLCESHPQIAQIYLDMTESILASSQQALCTISHYTLGRSPGTLVFRMDILLKNYSPDRI